MTRVFAFALGISSHARAGSMLDCFFPAPVMHPDDELANLITNHFEPGVQTVEPNRVTGFSAALPSGTLRSSSELLADTDQKLQAIVLTEDLPITSTAEAYLKLHLLSHRLALPNTLNLDNIFAHLPNVAWTTSGPIAVDELPDALVSARLRGEHLEVVSVDKFPKMTNYVVPTGVRIADTSRIRLGAYLGDGTTVMHEGFINFNAGALGPNMIEGTFLRASSWAPTATWAAAHRRWVPCPAAVKSPSQSEKIV